MDAVALPPYKSDLRNPKKIHNYPFLSMPSENFLPSFFTTTGVLQAPPPRAFVSQSYPPPYSHQQPPLLPLPAATPWRIAATYSSPGKKTGNDNRTRVSSLTPKKSKKEERKSPRKPIITSNRPDPKDVARVLPLISSSSGNIHKNKSFSKEMEEEVEMFSGSAAFSISPPPSSLPLPTFSLRPKLSCRAEAAAGIDSGATDDLRRLLRLR